MGKLTYKYGYFNFETLTVALRQVETQPRVNKQLMKIMKRRTTTVSLNNKTRLKLDVESIVAMTNT